ncbi:peptide MFS transporter [Dysgonomonas sp. ZJ709]|uniref:peptide MFS transporter n=1 Tax=Dysgonomonas sp. ZJ709 TaxID=2709797 RepID=UPI0013ED9E92|nr:peptide MFS transporter [Dysgonomonas sp. ZJ709]
MTKKVSAHPKGLKYLFFTEMWERFGYYLMLGIFLLYLKDADGLSLSPASAADIVGTYLGLVYLTPFLGGLIADKLLGYRKSILLGGILMSAGYSTLAIPGETAMWIAILLIIVGNGFFKPNISTLLGNLYAKDEYKGNKDAGYSIFYMGINLGAFICNFIAAYMRNNYGWGYAFLAAGVGMLIGIIIFLSGTRHIKEGDIIKKSENSGSDIGKVLLYVFVPAIICGGIGWLIPGNIFGSDSNDAFLIGTIPVIIFYASLILRSPKHERPQIKALLAIFAIMIVFWAVFKQNATALTTFAENYTERSISPSIADKANALGFVENITYKKDSVILLDSKMATIIDENGKVMKGIDYPYYYKNTATAKLPQDGESTSLISTEIFQSVNPFFIIILTPLVLSIFTFLRRKGKEPSTPAKMGWGLLITGLSSLVMACAVIFTDIYTDKASALWLICTYGVLTVGELLISPIGLSLTSKVSPKNITSFMMGGWFLSTSIGNKLSGMVAGLWDSFDNKAYYFLMNFTACLVAAIAIMLLVKWLRGIIQQH